ncbi:MAG: acyl-CoA desaturase [Chloroflexi bacterium]|nr:acyl-CoA desaturase [Chloroflexota bacterium]
MSVQSIIKQTPVKALPFTKQFGFRKILTERVEKYLKEHNLPARDVPAMYVKTTIVMGWWLVSYLLLLLGGFHPLVNVALCISFGLATAGMGFNVMHDANHGAYSKHPWINKLMGLTMELLGSCSVFWRQKHNVWHHTYTNIVGMDEDLETNGLLRFSPHDTWKPFHRYQHLYVPFVYSLAGLQWLLFRDFQIYFTGRTDTWHRYPPLSRKDKLIFWAGKLTILTLLWGIPLLVFPWWQVLIGFLLVMLTIGLALTTIFQLAHVMDAAEFPEPAGNPLQIENEWAVHEVQTTVNFAPGNKLLNWYAGGLNYQIEHHLFPHICHLHYPALSKIVRETCTEFGIRYNSIPTWRAAIASHLRVLRQLGTVPALSKAASV